MDEGGGSDNQSSAETSRLARQESFAASDGGSGGWYFGSSSSTADVADSAVTSSPDQSGAETSRLARQEEFAAGGGVATGGGGWYFGTSSVKDSAPLRNQAKDFYNKVGPIASILGGIVSFFANPPLTFVKLAAQNVDKLGTPNPYGQTFGAHSGGYVSALPAPGSYAAQQAAVKATPAGISSSYMSNGSNPGGYATQNNNAGGAVAVLAVLATLALT